MALEDTLGVPPPDYDTTQNTNDLTDFAQQRMNVAQPTLQTRLARKGLADSTTYDPIENTHQLNVRAREMIDQQQFGPAVPIGTSAGSGSFGPAIHNGADSFGPAVPTEQTATPAPPEKEGGGVSASEAPLGISGNVVAGGKGAARTAAESVTSAPLKGLGIATNQMTENQALAAQGVMPTMGEAGNAAPPPIAENPAYKAGQAAQTAIEKAIPMSEAEQSSIGGMVGKGIGAIPAIAAAAVVGGPQAAYAAGIGLFGTQAAVDTFDEALKHSGVSEADAAKAAGWDGAINAALMAVPLGIVLKPVKDIMPAFVGKAASLLADYGGQIAAKLGLNPATVAAALKDGRTGAALKGAGAFATIGEAQTALGNLVAKVYYDPDRKTWDWDTRRVIASLLTGGLFGAIFHQNKPASTNPNNLPGAPGAQPSAGAGPQAGPGGPSGAGAGPQAGPRPSSPSGGERTGQGTGTESEPHFSPDRRDTLNKVAGAYADDLGDKHTYDDIANWSDAELLKYLNDADRRTADRESKRTGNKGTNKSSEMNEPRTKAEKWAPGSDEEVLSQNGFNDAFINSITPLQRKQQADLLRGTRRHTEGPVGGGETTAGPRAGTREKPIKVETPEDVLRAGQETEQPTPAQAEAENHKSGHIELEDLGFTGKHSVTIETPVGGTRTGPIDEKTGMPAWQVTNYPGAYGRVKGTIGADGMHLDTLVGPGGQNFILDQNDPATGKFDEHKILAHWPSADAAREAYLAAYDDHDGRRIRSITPITKEQLWDWINKGDVKKPFAQTEAKPEGELSPEAQSGLAGLNDLFGGATTGPKPQAQTVPDHPTAEPLDDIRAQLADLNAKHRTGVWLPKATLDHLAKLGVTPEELVGPYSGVRDFDGQGGFLITRNQHLAEEAVIALKRGEDPQKIIGGLTGSGSGKPANGTTVIQQRNMGGHVTRERLVADADIEATKKEFAGPGRTVHTLTPQEALKRREDEIAQELSAKEKPTEGEEAHDHVKAVEGMLTTNGINPRNVNQGDIRRAAELMAEGVTNDPVDAFVRAVAENSEHQGYVTPEEIHDAFGEKIATLLAGDEGRTPIHGGPAAQEGPTTGPRLTGGAEEGGEPSGGGETGGVQTEGPQGTEGGEVTGHEVAQPEGAGTAVTEPTGTTTGHEQPGITTGPRGGVAEPERTEPANGEPSGEPGTEPTTGTTGERIGAGAEPVAEGEPTTTAEVTGGPRGVEGTEGGKAAETPQGSEGVTGGPRPKTKPEKEPEVEEETEEEKAKIEDESGEYLRGSRKEIWQLLHGTKQGITPEDLEGLTGPERAKYITKENVWKRPDYAALVADQGVEPVTAALLKRIYDRIPKKYFVPRWSNWTEQQAQEGYVRAVRAVRGAISDAKNAKELDEKAVGLAKQFKDQKIENTQVLAAANPYKEYSHRNPAEYNRQDLRIAERWVKEGFPNLEPWQRIFTVNERSKWDDEKRAYVTDADGKYVQEYTVHRKSGSKVAGPFTTRDEAVTEAKRLYDEQGTGTTEGETPERPHLDKLERTGPDHRKGKDIASGDEFINEFGFRGSQFGNWVTSQDERQKMLNLAWDALHDLAGVLNMPQKAMSLDGTLGIAFGARGKGGKGAGAAHYEPLERVINMTRIHGAGSLAHELFGHAFDHYLGELDAPNRYSGAPKGISGWYEQPREGTYKDNRYRLQNLPENLRKAANELMQALYFRPEGTEEILNRLRDQIKKDRESIEGWNTHIKSIREQIAKGSGDRATLKRYEEHRNSWVTQLNNHIEQLKTPERYKTTVETDYFKQAKKLSGKSGDYWKRPTEMFARAAESFVFDQLKAFGRRNDYLVQGVEGDRFRSEGFKGNPYPRGDERTAINLLFKQLVAALKTENGKFEGSKLAASDYARENADNVYDVIEAAKGEGLKERLIKEALELAGATERAVNHNLSDAFAEHMEKEAFPNILAARKFATDRGFNMDAKQIEEQLELGMVKLARKIVETNNSEPIATYNGLLDAYERQPKLSTRTSTSMREQAYSTPVPLAYIASRLAGITPDTKVYEPTAGNGALLIEANPTNVTANEINAARRNNLKELGFAPTDHNALSIRPDSKFDVVIANPPFGIIEEDGRAQTFDLGKYLRNYETTQVDHAIALKALDTLKNDGKAVLIVGSINKMNVEAPERFSAYQQPTKRLFYKALYDNYNVTDHFTVSGNLYEKQGAGWPVDVVVISGRGQSALPLPAVNLPPVFHSWDQLRGILNGKTSRELQEETGTGAGVSPGFGPTTGHGQGTGSTSGGGGRRRPGTPEQEQPVEVQPTTGAGGAGAGPDEGSGGGGLPGAGGEDTGRHGVGPDTGEAEQRPSGLKVSDEDINKALEDEFKSLFGEEEKKGPAIASAMEPPREQGPPRAEEEPKKPEFDPEKYEKAKVEFVKVAQDFPDLFGNVLELARAIMRNLKVQYKWGEQQIANIMPYLQRFMQDVRDGAIKLMRRKTERAAPGQTQVKYQPVSEGTGMDTQAPSNLNEAMQRGLRKIQAEVGPLSDYVSNELGWSKDKLNSYLGAEQVDALSQAIYNAKNNSAAINGDQTGIGKGRVGASVAQWAHKNGRIPVFVTLDPALYRDFYRDLKATGFNDYLGRKPRILVTNAMEKTLPLDEEDASMVLRRSVQPDVTALLNSLTSPDIVREKYDLVFTSYPQLQIVQGAEPPRRAFLRTIAPNAVMVFDESHNAAGEADVQRRKKTNDGKAPPPNRAGFARELVGSADGVSYMSATYAKNPNSMVFYAKTNMRLAVEDPKALPKLFSKGGIPMQQVVAANLAEDGQYLRRERDFRGINYNTTKVDVDRESYDNTSKSFGHINDLANYIKQLVKDNQNLGGEIAAGGAGVIKDNAVGDESITATGFASILHNAVAQMLLAMRSGAAAQEAIESIKRGEKPILGLYNTMESFLHNFVDAENEHRLEQHEDAVRAAEALGKPAPNAPELMGPGSPITISFKDILHRYLERARTIRIKDANGDTTIHYLTDAQLKQAGVNLYNRAKAQIEATAFTGMPVSPLDAIINDIKKAGYQIAEISGRDLIIDYSGNVPKLASRSATETGQAGKIRTVSAYNTKPENGGIHAIIMNQAGSTGLSMHSSIDFNDQSKRHMIIVQPAPDINVHMQMLGRINRTGQVVLPEYSQIVANVPAEARPAGLLSKKMASLNANTTAARKGALTSTDEDLPDFMNHYGDEVAAQFLLENPQFNRMMDYPLKIRDDGTYNMPDTMHRMTGKLALVYPSTLQGEILDRVRDEYNSLIEQKEAAGENMLEAKVLDLQSRPIEGTEVVPAKSDTTSRFGTAVVIHRAKIRRLVKPLSPKEIATHLEKSTGIEGLAGKTTREIADNLRMVETSAYDDPHRVKIREENRKALQEFAEFRRKELDAIEDPVQQEQLRSRLDRGKDQWQSLRDMLMPGTRWTLAMDDGNKASIVLHLERRGKAANPLALSTWRATFATAEGARTIALPFSRLFPADAQGNATSPATNVNAIDVRGRQDEQYETTLGRFEELQNHRTEQRYIATGNILAAYDWLDGKGRITHYTDYRGDIQQGVLTPHDFKLEEHATEKGLPIKSAEELKEWLDKNKNRVNRTPDGIISISLNRNSYIRKNYDINIVAKKIEGGVYYLDKLLTAYTGDFASRRITVTRNGRDTNVTVMGATVPEERIIPAIKQLMKLGADFRIDRGERKTYPIDTSDIPDTEAEKEAPETPPGATTAAMLPPRLTPAAEAKRDELQRVLRDAVDHFLGPGRVEVNFGTPTVSKDVGWGGYQGELGGSYDATQDILTVALHLDDPLWAASYAFHESYHGFQNLLKTDQERAITARELPRLRQMAGAFAKFLTPDQVANLAPYEAEAIAWQGYMTDRMRGGSGAGLHVGIRRFFEKLMKMFRQIKNALSGLGFRTTEDIWENLRTGEAAKREARTDKPLQSDIRTQRESQAWAESIARQKRWAALSEEERRARLEEAEAAEEAEAEASGMMGDFRDKIADLFHHDRRISATEILSDLSHREWVMQKDLEARMLGLTPEQVKRLYPAASRLPEALQFYVKKRLMPGRMATNIKNTNNKYVKPFVKAANDANIDLPTLGEYIQAKGAEQRNAQISEAWRDRPNSDFYKAAYDPSKVGGSGWSNHDAQDLIQRQERGPKAEAFRDLWRRFQEMANHDLELKLHYGLLSQGQASEFARRGPDYVPYKGFEDDPENAPDETGGRHGTNMGVRGREYQQATGRRSRADNPVVHMIDQLYRTIDRGEQNWHYNSVAQALGNAKMAGHDISDIARVNKLRIKRVIDKNTGLVRDVPDTSELNNPRAVHYKFRGMPRQMIFQSRPLAEAIKRTRPPFPKQLRLALVAVNKLKSLWTHYSPTFIPKHFARYYVEGLLNMSEYKGRANGNVSMTEWMKTAFPGLGDASRAINAVENGQTSHKDGRVNALMKRYQRMRQLGGNQSFRAMRDLDSLRDDLTRELDNLTKNTPLTQAKRSLKSVTDAIDHMFDVLTNAQQLATFDQLIRNGMPEQKAAYVARETNVDMQKNGLISHWAGLLFPFFRIAVNIGTRFSGASKRSSNYRRAIAAVFAAGAGMALWNYMMGGNDTDGTPFFEKIPEWDRALNMIVINPWHTDDKGRPLPYKMPMLFNWALPLTFGYHATGMALQAMGAIKSRMTIGERLGNMVKSVLMAFTPFGEVENMIDMWTPELLKGPAHVAENRDWKNRPIHVDEDKQHGPNAYSGKTDFQGRVRTGEGWKEIAQFINWASGGTRAKAGYVDPYPESVRELVKQPFQPQIQFGQDVANTGKSVMQGEVPKAKDIPILKTFAGTDYDAANAALGAERYYKSKHPWKQ